MEERIIKTNQIEQFKAYLLNEEKSRATIEKYLRDVRCFTSFADGRTITKELTISYKQALQDQKYALRSVNSMLISVNRFLEYLGWNECKVKTLRVQRQIFCAEEKELTKAEYLRLLGASVHNPRLNLILQTICSTGIRISELKYFTIEAARRGEVLVTCKNKTRTILIPGKLKRLLIHFCKKSHITTGPVFVTKNGKPVDRSNIWTQMKQLCNTANIKPSKVFPHNLRKLFAKTFYHVDKDIAKLADLLGHASIETTRIYIMTTGWEHRRKMEQLGLIV